MERLEPRTRLAALWALLALWPTWSVLGPVVDPDIWWHLRTGQWIAQHHALPATDPFSQQAGPWVVYAWLFDLASHALYQALGLQGPVLYRAVMATAIALLLWLSVRRREPSPTLALLLALGAFRLMDPVITERSWMLSILGVLLTIEGARATRAGSRAPLLYLPAAFVLWANTHIQFVYGLAVLGLAAGLDGLYRLARGRLPLPAPGACPAGRPWLLLGLCGLATLCNPFGPRLYATVLGYAGQASSKWVIELRSPMFRDPETWAAALLACAALVRLGWALRQRPSPEPGARDDLFELALTLLGFLSFLHYRRDVWLAVACSALAFAGRLPAWPERWGRPRPLLAALLVAELVTLSSLALGLPLRALEWPEARLRREVAVDYPAGAVAFVEQRGYPGPLYNHFNWGGYLIWSLPRLLVAMDGRTDVRAQEQISANLGTWKGTAEDPLLARSNLVIADRDKHALNRILERDPAWERVFRDENSEVFVRRSPIPSP